MARLSGLLTQLNEADQIVPYFRVMEESAGVNRPRYPGAYALPTRFTSLGRSRSECELPRGHREMALGPRPAVVV